MLETMFGLSTTTTAIIVAAVLAVVALAYLLFGWLRKHSWRVMFRGIGIIVLLAGLLTTGITTKFVGIEAFITWAKNTAMTNWIMLGLVLVGIGLLICVIGSFWPMVQGSEAATRREAKKARKLAALQPGAAPASAPAKPTSSPAPASTTPVSTATAVLPPATADDKEIDAILKSHGIN